MSIEQMKYISIMGPLELYKEFALKYIINSNIQLEPSYKALSVPGLIPFEEDTSLDNLRKRMRILNERFNVRVKEYDRSRVESELLPKLDTDGAEEFISDIEDKLNSYRKNTDLINADIQQREQMLKQILPLSELDVDIDEIFNFTFMKFRFGFMPKESYTKQKHYLEELDVVIVPASESKENIWLSYFMPGKIAPVIDNVFSAMGFERVRISSEVRGRPKVAIQKLNAEIIELQKSIQQERDALDSFLHDRRYTFEDLYHKIIYLSKVNEIKKMCSHTRETFFLVGWIPFRYFKKFSSELATMDRIIFASEDPEYIVDATPPTIMKNGKFFKPFESLVTMYGLPSPKEIDPTPLMTITYVLMFGFMFGDVGQGMVIALLGLFLHKYKKMALGGVMLYVGVSSTIFGFIYGSVFGSEAVLHPLWVSPLHGKDTINTMLYVAVGYGAFIIIVTMITNMINNIRMRKWGKLLFDKNGLAGLLFYGGLIVMLLIALKTGRFSLTGLALVIVIILPALMIYFREPLENAIFHKKRMFPQQNKGIFFVESAFELFETLLSFFSSTVSFARVGAFTLNHAGLSLAVWTLYEMMEGVGGIAIVILGNMLTIGLEGLIVGIQCMRLEYYEMFGRFYIGEGKEFRPVRVTEDSN